MRGIEGKVALITGACKGIGKAIAHRFLVEGAKVAYVCHYKDQYEQAISELGDMSVNVMGVTADVSNSDQLTLAISAIIARFGSIDFLINNAGREGVARIEDVDEVYWDEVFAANVKSCFFSTKLMVRHMIEMHIQGSIINIASQAGLQGERYNSVYSSSKFALIGLTQSIALETAQHGIRVNAICPGPVETSLLDRSFSLFSDLSNITADQFRLALINDIPLGRIAAPDEIAGSVVFLCSDDARFITGASLVLSGGMVLH